MNIECVIRRGIQHSNHSSLVIVFLLRAVKENKHSFHRFLSASLNSKQIHQTIKNPFRHNSISWAKTKSLLAQLHFLAKTKSLLAQVHFLAKSEFLLAQVPYWAKAEFLQAQVPFG